MSVIENLEAIDQFTIYSVKVHSTNIQYSTLLQFHDSYVPYKLS